MVELRITLKKFLGQITVSSAENRIDSIYKVALTLTALIAILLGINIYVQSSDYETAALISNWASIIMYPLISVALLIAYTLLIHKISSGNFAKYISTEIFIIKLANTIFVATFVIRCALDITLHFITINEYLY